MTVDTLVQLSLEGILAGLCPRAEEKMQEVCSKCPSRTEDKHLCEKAERFFELSLRSLFVEHCKLN